MTGPETLYVEPTNRCNLRCTTCPRSFFPGEPPADMPADRFLQVLDQVPTAKRIVLHGMGEPLLHPRIGELVRLAKGHGAKVLFNTNGLLLTGKVSALLVDAGLDELRVSVDMPDPRKYAKVREGGRLSVVYANVEGMNRTLTQRQREVPVVSFWMTEGRSRLKHLKDLIADAARLNVREVYLQRLILTGAGDANEGEAVFRKAFAEKEEHFASALEVARRLGVKLWGSGDADPSDRDSEAVALHPWQRCRRPFDAAYVTANGNLLPCCLTPFTAPGKTAEFVLGNLFRTPFAELWDGPLYHKLRADFLSSSPPACCALCGAKWSL